MKINDIVQEDIMPKHFSQMHGKRSKETKFGPNTKTQSNYMRQTYDPATNTLDTDLEKTEMMPGHGPMGMRGHQGRRYTKKTGSSGQKHGTGHDTSSSYVSQEKRSKPAQNWGEPVLDRGDSLSRTDTKSTDRKYTPSQVDTTQRASTHDVRGNRSATDIATTTMWDPKTGKNVVRDRRPADISDFKTSTGMTQRRFDVRKASGGPVSNKQKLAVKRDALAHAQANRGIDPRNQTI